jgi:indolepyruvate ferredoxin oxidoreductase
MPHQSDLAMQSACRCRAGQRRRVPRVRPLRLGAVALGELVSFTALSEVVESGSTVDLGGTNARVAGWKNSAGVAAVTGTVA